MIGVSPTGIAALSSEENPSSSCCQKLDRPNHQAIVKKRLPQPAHSIRLLAIGSLEGSGISHLR
jgi:hypothetical protein